MMTDFETAATILRPLNPELSAEITEIVPVVNDHVSTMQLETEFERMRAENTRIETITTIQAAEARETELRMQAETRASEALAAAKSRRDREIEAANLAYEETIRITEEERSAIIEDAQRQKQDSITSNTHKLTKAAESLQKQEAYQKELLSSLGKFAIALKNKSEKYGKLKNDLKYTAALLEDSKRSIGEKKSAYADEDEKIASKESDKRRLDATSKTKVAELSDRITELEMDKTRKEETIARIRALEGPFSKTGNAEALMLTFHEDFEGLPGVTSDLISTISAKEKLIRKTELDLAAMESDIDSMKRAQYDANGIILGIQRQIDNYESEIHRIEEAMSKLEDDIREDVVSVKNLKREFEETIDEDEDSIDTSPTPAIVNISPSQSSPARRGKQRLLERLKS